jgi:hypothetical protein
MQLIGKILLVWVAQAKSRMNFGTQKGHSTHVIDATSCIKM